MLDKLRLDFTSLSELLALSNFKSIEVEKIGNTIVVYVSYDTEEDSERAYKVISKYVRKLKGEEE